jgi:signal transduction histidine kinase
MTTRTSAPSLREGALSWCLDAAVAAVLVGAFWVPSLAERAGAEAISGWVLAGLVATSVMVRWRMPVLSTVVAFTTTLAGWLTGSSLDPMLAAAWCLYPLATRRAAQTSVTALTGVGLLVALSAVAAVPGRDAAWSGQRALVAVAAIGGAWLLGHIEGRRIDAARALEATRSEQARSEQQIALARDVHDVVGHSLAVISAEAGVARMLPDTDEAELRQSLESIEQRARAALVDVQHLVRLLRSTPGQVPPVAAAGSLADVIASARAAGLRVDSSVDAGALPPDVAETVVRLLQEAVSNVVRHADASSCSVTVSAAGGDLRVRVEDDGRGLAPGTRPGFGVVGMRERAEKIGGELWWSPRDGGGTVVQARLPLEAAS